MINKWTGEIIGKMHNERITRKQLADKMGVSRAYVTMILNGSRSPYNAEGRLSEALDELIKAKSPSTPTV